MGHARALLSLPNETAQQRLWQRIIRQGLPVRRVEELVRANGGKAPSGRKESAAGMAPADGGIRMIESRLRHTLGTKVQVKARTDGKGEIVVEYYSPDDLERIVEMITKE